MSSWRTTAAQQRAMTLGLALVVVGVLLHRPDATVLGAPLLVAALWALSRRPRRAPELRCRLAHRTLREGQATRWVVGVESVDGLEDVAMVVPAVPYTSYHPASGSVVARDAAAAPSTRGSSPAEPVAELVVELRSLRWGQRDLGHAVVAATGLLGGYRWVPEPVPAGFVSTVPLPASFSTSAPLPHPDGLVGQNRSGHPGEGGELADIRPFRTGDRLRRVNWPVSLRTGALHVTAMHADQDTEVALLVDAVNDIGRSEGVGGTSTSLDSAVRAAGAIAEHFLRAGDRVSLQVLGSRHSGPVPARAGRPHLRLLLDTLSRVKPASGTVGDDRLLQGQLRHRLSPGAMVIVLTPIVSATVLSHAASLSRRGQTVVVVDTLPREVIRPDLEPDVLATLTPVANRQDSIVGALAWRLRLLERDREIHRAQDSGVPVVPWAGSQTLDQVLRDLGRRSRAPRVVNR